MTRNLFHVVRHDLLGCMGTIRPARCYWLECEGRLINPCAFRAKAEEICKFLNDAARRWKEGGK